MHQAAIQAITVDLSNIVRYYLVLVIPLSGKESVQHCKGCLSLRRTTEVVMEALSLNAFVYFLNKENHGLSVRDRLIAAMKWAL